MINVTQPFLPDYGVYEKYLKEIWERKWLTNNGPLVVELEARLKEYLGVKHLLFCSNGTIALQIAIKALGLRKEVITTPFSYVATTTCILWENCKPVFADILETDYNIDPAKIEEKITPDTEAILATHVFGNPCNVEKIEAIAQKHGLKVIYDGAHAFGTLYNRKQLLSFGDVSTCSFHATKLFHTIEGGCIITDNDELAEKMMLYRQFGHINDDYFSIGVNGKNSEFHAGMGLSILPRMDEIIAKRKALSELYASLLKDSGLLSPVGLPGTEYNYGYYPVLFKDEIQLLKVKAALLEHDINPRRYFYPSLNGLPYLEKQPCGNSENIALRIACLPFYYDLDEQWVEKIASLILKNL
jgi:dTDP-4-amino-4,6-dideoxygalactose transaminase